MGNAGPPVRELQEVLNVTGAGLVADGQFGSLTDGAVRSFQSATGRVADGVVGPKTWEAFKSTGGPGAAPVPAKATDPALDFRVKGLPDDHLKVTDTIFFDHASSTVPDEEEGKLDTLAADPADLLLEGSSSEEGSGNVALAGARLKAVDGGLAKRKHAGTRTRRNSAEKAVGQLDYRRARKVKVTHADAPDPLADCKTAGSVVACPTSVGTALGDGADLLQKAINKLSSPGSLSKEERGLVKDLFVEDTDAAIGEVAGHMINLRQFLLDTRDKRQEPNQPEPTSGPFHRCENICNSTCATGALAFNQGVDASSRTTFCEGFTAMSSPVLGTGATVEASQIHLAIHEGAHGTKVIDCQDFAKGSQRAFKLLTRDQALHNADSFTALARNLVNPKSAAIRPITPDTGGLAGVEAVQEPLAWLDRWLEAADFETSQLYDALKDQEGTPWADVADFPGRTMVLVSEEFPVTKPPAAPVRRDREKVAAIYDRYDQLRNVLQTNTDSLVIDRGPALLWQPGPGRALTIPNGFTSLAVRTRIELLLSALLTAFPDVRAGQEGNYARLAPRLCNRRTPGFAFSS